jgi:trehalose/maltose transport system permease protein
MSYQADVAPLPELANTSKAWRAPEGSLGKSRERLAWLLVLPSLLVVALVALYPLYETIRLSFTNTRLASAREPRGVGFANYQSLLTEGAFRDALSHTIVFTIASVALETLLGLAIALVIHSNFRGRGGVRTAMLVPWAIPTVVSA